jgi:hypothetical protein
VDAAGGCRAFLKVCLKVQRCIRGVMSPVFGLCRFVLHHFFPSSDIADGRNTLKTSGYLFYHQLHCRSKILLPFPQTTCMFFLCVSEQAATISPYSIT